MGYLNHLELRQSAAQQEVVLQALALDHTLGS